MSLPFPLSFDGVESVVELVLTGVIGRSAAALRPIGFSSSSGETSPRSTGVEDVTDGDEADVSLDEGMESCSPISTDFVDSNCRLTILTPSRIAVRVSTQTFLPSSHFETAEENRYESSRPDTIR